MRRVLDFLAALFALGLCLGAIGVAVCWIAWPVVFVLWMLL